MEVWSLRTEVFNGDRYTLRQRNTTSMVIDRSTAFTVLHSLDTLSIHARRTDKHTNPSPNTNRQTWTVSGRHLSNPAPTDHPLMLSCIVPGHK